MTASQARPPAEPLPDDFDGLIDKLAHKTVTFATLGAVVNQFFDLLVQMKNSRDRQAAAVEARVSALEGQRGKGVSNVRWRGVFKQGDMFHSGELATFQGALWACRRDTSQIPGRPADADTSDWVLIVKSGKDLR